jgi:type II secretory pathway component PulF
MLISEALGPTVGYSSPLLTLLVLIALALMARNSRRARAMIVMHYLEQAIRLNLPIPAMLRAAEAAERGTLRRRLTRLRDNLEAGSPVSAALQRSVPGVPLRFIGLIHAAERIGRLRHTLGRIVRQQEMVVDRRPMQSIMLRWYPMLLLLCVSPVFGVVMIFVMPKIKQIFTDFHLQLPPATVWMIDMWDTMQLPLAALSLIALAVLSGRMFAELIPARQTTFSPLRAVTDRGAWVFPPWRSVVRSGGLADLCHILVDAIEAGQPMDRALAEAADGCDNRVLRSRVRRWGEAVTAGVPLVDAARQAKMPPLMVGMLSTSQSSTGTRDVFAFLLRYYDSRFSAASALLRGAAVPVMVAIMAVFVTTLALGLFVPLVELMNHLGSAKGVM